VGQEPLRLGRCELHAGTAAAPGIEIKHNIRHKSGRE
jgi:hypothetical protein